MGLSSKNPPTRVEGLNSPNLLDHPGEGATHLREMILSGFPCRVGVDVFHAVLVSRSPHLGDVVDLGVPVLIGVFKLP